MSDQVPSGNMAFYAFFEMVALAFAFEGVSALLSDRSWTVWLPALATSLFFFIVGIKFPALRSRLEAVKWEIVGKRVHNILLTFVAFTALIAVTSGYYAFRDISRAWHNLAASVDRLPTRARLAHAEPGSVDDHKSPITKSPTGAGNSDQNDVISPPSVFRQGELSASTAQFIAESAQGDAAGIMQCLAEPDRSFSFCFTVYGSKATEIHDELRNCGLEFKELNDVANQLETKPSKESLRQSALVLRAVADKLIDMSRSLN